MNVLLASEAPRYVPLVSPLPLWDHWYLLLIPLCIAVAIVYKSIKCRTMDQVPREASVLTAWIIGGMIVAAVVLAGIVKAVERIDWPF
jgi:prolipoprotein diacylglyceryltransferase